jgi:hypothetical protein
MPGPCRPRREQAAHLDSSTAWGTPDGAHGYAGRRVLDVRGCAGVDAVGADPQDRRGFSCRACARHIRDDAECRVSGTSPLVDNGEGRGVDQQFGRARERDRAGSTGRAGRPKYG